MTMTPASTPSSSLHPVFWIAGISVTLVSLAGLAALTGLLPLRHDPLVAPPPPVMAVASAQAPTLPAAIAPTAAPATTLVTAPAPAVTLKLPPAPHKTPKKIVREDAATRLLPPPSGSGVPADYLPPADAGVPPPLAGVPADYVAPPAVPVMPPSCVDCGVVANVRQVTKEGEGSGAGAIVGGILGGALASNIGKGDGRTLASLAGAIGGGILGNTIEKSQRWTTSYQVTLRMEDGSIRLIDADSMPPWRIGDKVRLERGAIVLR